MASGRAKAAAAAKAPSSAAATAPAAMRWSRGDDKLLEMLLMYHFPRWDLIASRLLGNKTPEQAAQRYDRMVDEVTRALHATHVETPREWDHTRVVVVPAEAPAEATADVASAGEEDVAAIIVDGEASEPVAKMMMRKGRRDRKKPEAWTQQEHNLFLEGLEKYGKGKWKLMASEYLTTKSASQIASHHQKHRNRIEQRKRNACKRASIHDITRPTTTAVVGEPPAAQKYELLGRGGVDERPEAPPPGDGGRGPVETAGGEPASDDGTDGFVGAAEEFPGEDDPGTLFNCAGAR